MMAVFMAIVVVVGVFKCVWTATGLERGESSAPLLAWASLNMNLRVVFAKATDVPEVFSS